MLEKHIDREQGYLFIPHPKEKKSKNVPLLPEDVELLSMFPQGLPEMPFFRHTTGHGGIQAGTPFGPKTFWKWWRLIATVSIQENDASGLPVEGATVEGHWSGSCSGAESGRTDKNGQVSFRTGWIRASGVVNFTIDEIVKNGQVYKLSGETEDSVTGEAGKGK